MDKVIVITGPTATGKSELAQRVAQKINGEIISCDSMQIYKGLDIGTGKLKISERRVIHHGLDIMELGEPFSASLFQKYGRSVIQDIKRRQKASVLCGGTGFYIRAVIDDYSFAEGEQIDNPVREKFQKLSKNLTNKQLWDLLFSLDPKSANVVEPNDVKRVIRALELNERGESYAKNKEKLKNIKEFLPSIWIGLKVDPEILANRISDRVDAMIEEGLVDEVKSLVKLGFENALCSPKAIGYREILDYLKGKKTLDSAIVDIKTNTRRYAKRQRCWFRAEKRIHWIDANILDFDRLTKDSLDIIDKCM